MPGLIGQMMEQVEHLQIRLPSRINTLAMHLLFGLTSMDCQMLLQYCKLMVFLLIKMVGMAIRMEYVSMTLHIHLVQCAISILVTRWTIQVSLSIQMLLQNQSSFID